MRRVVDAFRVSAANSVQAGFHGVELHAGHGYLLAQFLSRVNNTRDGEYGDRVALLISQGFRSVADIERALRSGADLVGMARPFMADPDFVRKVIAGDERSVRPCTGCNEGCRTFEPTGSCSETTSHAQG